MSPNAIQSLALWPAGVGLARASPNSVLERGPILAMQGLSMPAVTWKGSMALAQFANRMRNPRGEVASRPADRTCRKGLLLGTAVVGSSDGRSDVVPSIR